VRRLFEPLGYKVDTEHHLLDEKFPEWGGFPHFGTFRPEVPSVERQVTNFLLNVEHVSNLTDSRHLNEIFFDTL
jgi:hypothetical protein